MTTESIANLFERSRKEGRHYRARCPVHKSKGLTLGIYPKEERTILVCYAGCAEKDILAAVNLTWKHTLYQERVSNPQTRRRAMLIKRLEVWERILGLADMLHASEAKIEKAEQQIIWMRRELYPEQDLPRRLRGTRV